jgi:ParB family chromosome partitioning protein
MNNNKKKKALGRGLSALLNDSPKTPGAKKDFSALEGKKNTTKSFKSVLEIPISQIQTNPYQPRTIFDEEKLQELAQSIAELGVIQPITVRKIDVDTYQLISGERRLRASQLIDKKTIPAFVRTANDQEMLEMAIVENIQRQELDPIEVALSYQRLLDECKQTQEQISERLGKKRSTITNALRLLQLQPLIQAGLRDRLISPGHAKAILGLQDEGLQLDIYKNILKDSLSVRQTEELVKTRKQKKVMSVPKNKELVKSLLKKWKQNEDLLSQKLETKSKISFTEKGAGKISLSFKNEEDLQRILDLLGDQ